MESKEKIEVVRKLQGCGITQYRLALEEVEKDLEENKHLRKQLQKARNEKRRWKNKALQQKEILDAIKKVFYDKLYNWHLLDNMPSLKLENEPKEYEIIRQWIKQWLEGE